MIFGKWDERSGYRNESRSDVRPVMATVPVVETKLVEAKKVTPILTERPAE